MKKKFRFQWGAFLLFLVYGGLFFLLISRIVTIQATDEAEGQVLAAKAAAKYEKERTLKAERGKILDRNGEIIAEDSLSYRLVAVLNSEATINPDHPRHVIDAEKTAETLAKYIPMSKEVILERLNKVKENPDMYQVEFGKAGRDINHELMTKIENEHLPGIGFVKDSKRFYPNGKFASYLIGFAQKEEQKDKSVKTVGKMGLEYTYDKILTGTDGEMSFESDKWGYLLPNTKEMITPAKDGASVYLTIDKTVQNFLEDAMSRVEAEYNPTKMIGVVADAKTGEVLGMTQRPTFDPETREGLTTNWLNDVVETTIEPGSTMKTFTVASAVDAGKWDPNAWYKSGSYTLGPDTVRDHNRVGWGSITFLEGFQRSSNVAMAYLLERLGNEKFIHYLERFGFGQKTGIDLPDEAPGKLIQQNGLDYVVSTFGQGLTVTPIQLIQAETAITNNGTMMRPYVIDQIVDPNNGKVIKDSEPKKVGTPISSETAQQMRKLLTSTVTSEHGTGKKFALKDYTIAGKTGTAQITDGKGHYLRGSNDYLFSFLGFAPAEDPQIIVYVAVQQPVLKDFAPGSDPVSKVFRSVTENSLKYLNIKPSEIKPVEPIAIRNFVGDDAKTIQSSLQKLQIRTTIIGEDGPVTSQFPSASSKLLPNEQVLLKTKGAITVPDFTGWSKKQLLNYKEFSGLSVEMSGEGYVVQQSVTAGTKAQGPIVVKLETPEEMMKQQNVVEEIPVPEEIIPQD